MPDIAVHIDRLSKLYHIGRAQQRHDTLRDALVSAFKRPNVGTLERSDELWALKDVSLEIKRGEVVGIIGRNGAGKSTLLKILTRITEPTSGRAEIHGRVGSLLEVGTGFHPELTGRENIYLNGAILGMRRFEIERKFDEIVAFSEIERFLDTPVKRYSSGMYVRLAFAVAAHMEPEVLLVDEVLAVGDAAFQKKALGKMGDLVHEGRTVLFVSHNMTAVSALCTKAILIDHGRVGDIGDVREVVQAYLQGVGTHAARGTNKLRPASGLPLMVHTVSTCDQQGNVAFVLSREDAIMVRIEGEVYDTAVDYHIALDIVTANDTLLFRTHSFEQADPYEILRKRGPFVLECVLPPDLLPAGTYRLGIATARTGKVEMQNTYPALEFNVVQNKLLGGRFLDTRGLITPRCEWIRAENADQLA